MKGLKVVCPNCKRKDFETTDKYNPDVTPNGAMVKCLLPYAIDWLCSSTTLVSEMNCPECQCNLAPSGRLTIFINEESKVKEGIPPADKQNETREEKIKRLTKQTNTGLYEDRIAATRELAEIEREAEHKEEPAEQTKSPEPVIPKLDEQTDVVQSQKGFVCDVCGKECKSEFGLRTHKRSHKN